jgi:hypothetical protein
MQHSLFNKIFDESFLFINTKKPTFFHVYHVQGIEGKAVFFFTVICKWKKRTAFSAPIYAEYNIKRKKNIIKLPGQRTLQYCTIMACGIWSNIMLKNQMIITWIFDTMDYGEQEFSPLSLTWSHKLLSKYIWCKWLISGRQSEICTLRVYCALTENSSRSRHIEQKIKHGQPDRKWERSQAECDNKQEM